MEIKYNEITVVYFESSSHSEEVATFVDDETYSACRSALEKYAAKNRMVVTESVVEMPDRNIGVGILEREEFIAEVFEIAFGDDAINRDFSYGEVLETLREFSDTALQLEQETDFPPDI